MHPLLSKIETSHDLHGMTVDQLEQVASEIRDVLCNLLNTRTAHFASNLGVVELCLALHSVYDFPRDRLIGIPVTKSIPTNLSREDTTNSTRCVQRGG